MYDGVNKSRFTFVCTNFLLEFMMGYDMGGGSEGSGIHIKHGMAFERFVTASKSECYSEYPQFKNNNQIELKQSTSFLFNIS
jgi:hypothetical protein